MQTRSARPSPTLAIILPHPPVPLQQRRSSLLTPSPHTPSQPLPAQLFNAFPSTRASSPRNSCDSWASSILSDDNAIDPGWEPEEVAFLTKTLDALPSHLFSPFRGPIPPPNVLDKIARGVLQAKAPGEWPHSSRATRAKLAIMARDAARETARENDAYRRRLTLEEADEERLSGDDYDEQGSSRMSLDEHELHQRDLQTAAEMGRRLRSGVRPIFGRSAMDFLPAGMDSNLDRLSTRLRRTDRIITSSYHPYARSPTKEQPNPLDSPMHTDGSVGSSPRQLRPRLSSSSLSHSRIPTLRRIPSSASTSGGSPMRESRPLSAYSTTSGPDPGQTSYTMKSKTKLGRTASEMVRPGPAPSKLSRSESYHTPAQTFKRAPSFSPNFNIPTLKRAPSFDESLDGSVGSASSGTASVNRSSGHVTLSSLRDNIEAAAAAKDVKMRPSVPEFHQTERKRKASNGKNSKKEAKKAAAAVQVSEPDSPRRSKRLKRTSSPLERRGKATPSPPPEDNIPILPSEVKERRLRSSTKAQSSNDTLSPRERTSSTASKTSVTRKDKSSSKDKPPATKDTRRQSVKSAGSFGPELMSVPPVPVGLEIPPHRRVPSRSTVIPIISMPLSKSDRTPRREVTPPPASSLAATPVTPPSSNDGSPRTLRRIGTKVFPTRPSRTLLFGNLYSQQAASTSTSTTPPGLESGFSMK